MVLDRCVEVDFRTTVKGDSLFVGEEAAVDGHGVQQLRLRPSLSVAGIAQEAAARSQGRRRCLRVTCSVAAGHVSLPSVDSFSGTSLFEAVSFGNSSVAQRSLNQFSSPGIAGCQDAFV